jgi:hypothetical protein
MSKKLMLIAAAVFALTINVAAQGNPAPTGSANPPAGQTGSTKPAKKGRKPGKKPAKKVSKKAAQPAPTAPVAPAPAPSK